MEGANEGNRLIAEYLGYKYIASNSLFHEKPNGISYGYWVRNISLLKDLPNHNLPAVIHGAKLGFEESWEWLFKIIHWIEQIPDLESSFTISKTGVTLKVVRVDGNNFDVGIPFLKGNEKERREAVWNVIVLFLRYYKNEFSIYLSKTL